MSDYAKEQELDRLRGKVASYERHAIFRKRLEALDKIAKLEKELKVADKKEVKLSDVKEMAPTPEKAAEERKAAASNRNTVPAGRSKRPVTKTVAPEKDEA